MLNVEQSQVKETGLKCNNCYQAQVLYTDPFGWPITARPYASSSTSSRDFLEVSEVINQIVRRACLFSPDEVKKPTTTASTTTTITTANLSFANRKANKAETDEVFKVPVQAAASYSDLVSVMSNFFGKIIK